MTDKPTRQFLADDDSDPALEQKAEQQRLAAFQTAVPAWHGKALQWTASRASRYLWLKLPAPPLQPDTLAALRASRAEPKDVALQQQANQLYHRDTAGDESHYHNATIILYLAAHEARDWREFAHDKARFLEAIETWTDANVTPGEIFELADVTNALLAAADSTRAIVRPQSGAEDEEGN